MIVSRETSDRLELYGQLLTRWNERINLVSSATIADLQTRHIGDCLQLVELNDAKIGTWVDFGSGGGLPGMVLAIAMADTDMQFLLVESDRRKSAFLQTVVRETGLKRCTVIADRIENLPPLNAYRASARALAPLSQLVAYLHLHMAPTGKAYLMKGRRWQSEVKDAEIDWRFDYASHSSKTEEGAAILEISGVSHGTV
ncbi:16S rRNA (guanine(527)-N(7))-methyltransferase RsmG [Paracoccus sediminis]|uniref:Ribosomal RNA small subunit methyltransferase G n=1 Tax=Paracoccus sediminis TaxID=1214787 RepID=A0A238VGL5_9RHOB|nr:16S rRNA (guanine(527)-N(7))-methyltransferase RsmG [Paracoccus sediminis]TBN52063.1 16S rRNA (guanine(527)-N(7))-methyltransferase RsmG [Paracoccus sediminis]SNR33341.1 16S rRNA m(7)G-527 methyltransferase [Paracoccus sediminis]